MRKKPVVTEKRSRLNELLDMDDFIVDKNKDLTLAIRLSIGEFLDKNPAREIEIITSLINILVSSEKSFLFKKKAKGVYGFSIAKGVILGLNESIKIDVIEYLESLEKNPPEEIS